MRTWIPRSPVVLVLDDDPDILNVLGLYLESEGCTVRQAADPARALEQIEGVDVVLVDQRMPSMKGTEFIDAARRAGSAARFLVISAVRGVEREARDAGADGFLAKPLDVREMLEAIGRLFALGQRLDKPS